MTLIVEITSLVVLLFLSAFFSGSETALVSLSRLKIRHLVSKKIKNALVVKKLKDDPDRLLSTILIGNNLVNVAASVLATSISIKLFGSTEFGFTVGIMTLLLLVFGEITPKSIAVKNKEAVALKVAKPIWLLSILFYPVIRILKILLRLSGPAKKRPMITEEELKSYVYAGKEEGTIKEEESRMISNIFEFDNVELKKVMTPIDKVVAIDLNQKISEALEIMIKAKYSRYPVFEESSNKIAGIVHIKDALAKVHSGKGNMAIKSIIRKPFVVTDASKLDVILRKFQRRKEHMAVVADDKGNVVGIATIEDVLEEIVGEIMDETDISY